MNISGGAPTNNITCQSTVGECGVVVVGLGVGGVWSVSFGVWFLECGFWSVVCGVCFLECGF
jgi:hypothetical protein